MIRFYASMRMPFTLTEPASMPAYNWQFEVPGSSLDGAMDCLLGLQMPRRWPNAKAIDVPTCAGTLTFILAGRDDASNR